jgi:Fe-S cluster biogenesis protein NfuA
VHDAISLEGLGVPSACVITDGFLPTGRMMADLAGLPGYPMIVIQHPIADNTDQQLGAKAEQIVQQSVDVLLSGVLRKADGLATIREMLQADKSDLELLGIQDGTARFKLLLNDPACADCVMPRSYLEPMILRHLQQTRPDVRQVILDDPRQAR